MTIATATGFGVPRREVLWGPLDTWSEYIALGCMVLLLGGMSAVWGYFGNISEVDRESGNTAFQAVSMLFYGYFTIMVVRDYGRELPALLLRNWPIVLLTTLCLVSALWSVQGLLTFRRGAALSLSTVFAVYLGVKFEANRLIWIFSLALLAVCILGFLAAGVPGLGLDGHAKFSGALQGLTGQKNCMGRYAGLSTLVFGYFIYFRLGPRWFRWSGAVFSFLVLLLTTSKTPLACVLAAAIAMPFLHMLIMPRFNGLRIKIEIKILLIIFALFAAVVVVVWGIPLILELLNRDDTLSGRTRIWDYAIPIGMVRPILGAGYRAFWTDTLTADFLILNPYWRGTDSDTDADAQIGNGHSGYLDVWLETGWVGVAFFVIFLLTFLLRVMVSSQRRKDGEANRRPFVFFAALILFYILYSYTEKVTLQQSELFWTMLVASYFSMDRALHLRRKLPPTSAAYRRPAPPAALPPAQTA